MMTGGTDAGAAYVYSYSNGTWTLRYCFRGVYWKNSGIGQGG